VSVTCKVKLVSIAYVAPNKMKLTYNSTDGIADPVGQLYITAEDSEELAPKLGTVIQLTME
jgi:hypothetical protein